MNYTQRTINKCKQFIGPFGQKHEKWLIYSISTTSVFWPTPASRSVEKDKKKKTALEKKSFNALGLFTRLYEPY